MGVGGREGRRGEGEGGQRGEGKRKGRRERQGHNKIKTSLYPRVMFRGMGIMGACPLRGITN